MIRAAGAIPYKTRIRSKADNEPHANGALWVAELDSQRIESKKRYLEFLRTQALSVGLYVLRAGEQDSQQPHTEGEVYYVIEGRARFKAGEKDWVVGPGSALFVEAGVEHRFYEIEEDLKALVFFAPPEGSSDR